MPKVVDLSEFQAQARQRGPRCGVRRMELEGEQKEKFDAAMASERISARAIAAVLKNWGYEVTAQTVERHRGGVCACER